MLTRETYPRLPSIRKSIRSQRSLWTVAVLAIAGLLRSVLVHGQTLNWDPNLTMGFSDNSGAWDQSTQFWWNPVASQFTGWINGDDAVIGAGGVLNAGSAPVITLDTAGPMVANSITFNAVGAGSTAGYTITDNSGTGANTLGVSGANAMTITDNAASVTTTINAPIVSNGVNPFTLNMLGTGNLSFGGAIGVTTGGNTGAGTLRVGSSPGTGYSGTVTLNTANKLSAITVNSGTVSVNNTATSLGSGTVTLSGGTLSLGAPIAVNVATSQTGEDNTKTPVQTYVYNTMNSSMSAAGVVPVAAGNWNNLLVSRGTTPMRGYPGNSKNLTGSNLQSTLPFTLGDANGATSTAQVVNWWGSNTFNIGSSATNGTQQMLSSWLNANKGTGGTGNLSENQSSFTLDHIPFSNYSVYLYYFNNTAGALGTAYLQSGTSITGEPAASSAPTAVSFAGLVKPTMTGGNQNTTYFFTTGNGTAAPTTFSRSTATAATTTSTPVTDYVQWDNVSGSSLFVAIQELTASAQTPGLAGIEIVPNLTVSNPISVTSSSGMNVGTSIPFTGGLTITSSGSPTVLSVTGLGTLDTSPSTTTFSGVGGTLNVVSGATVNLGTINDGGNGITTTGAGTIVLTKDSTSTVTGPMTFGSIVKLNMTSTTTGSGTGTGAVTVASGGTLTGNGIVTPGGSNRVMVNNGGTILAPGSGNTLRVNGPATVNGLAQSAAGSLIFAGATTVNTGGNFTVGNGQVITASGGLTLAGGGSTFTVTSAGTTSPFVNVSGGAGPTSLGVTGSNTITILLSGNPNTTVGSTTTYDLYNYTGTDLAPTAAGSMLTFTGGGTLTVGTPATGGLPQADQLLLVDIPGSGGGPNQIQLQVTVPGPITWTGQTDANWNTTSTNWATATPAATQYVDGSTVTFADKNPLSPASNVTHTAITVQAAGVSPASISFTNTGAAAGGVDFSFTGGAISGASGGITLSGTGSVTFNNSNTYTGAVAVNAGQLVLGNANALGSTSGVTVASGAALVLNNTSGNPTTFSTKASSGNIPLSIGGAGLAASPAGALDSIAGNNTYSGAITLSAATTINSASTTAGDGLTLGAIGTTASNFGLTFTGAGNTTVGGVINGGGSVTMGGTGVLTLSGANTYNGLQVNASGTVIAKSNTALGATTGSVNVAAGGALGLQGGISVGANPLTISGAGVAASPTGALNSISGANSFAGAITLAGTTTIGSATSGNTLTLSGAIDTTANGYGLTFVGAGNTAAKGVIGGGGALTMNGGGTVSLSGANAYGGGTKINSGVVSVSTSNSALGTGSVTLAGGTLQFQALGSANNIIGVHIAADGGTTGSASGEQPETIGSTVSAGVVPTSHWNDFIVTRFQNGGDRSNLNPPPAQSVPTSTTPFSLTDGTGATSTAQVTAWQANNTFSTYGAPQTVANAQLVNGFIGAIIAGSSPNFPAKLTVGSVPFGAYSVYVYFNNNNSGQNAQISLTSGGFASPTYYVQTQGTAPLNGTTYTFTNGTSSTTSGTYTASNYVVIPVPAPGSTGSNDTFTVTLASAGSATATPGIAAVEIVSSAGPTIGNSIAVTANSTIDVTGAASATAGNLSIGAQTLSVTGGSFAVGAPYTMNLGTTALSGNATFNVSNNTTGSGNGLGTLRLGPVGDGGQGFGITVNNGNTAPGTVLLSAGGTYTGPTNVNGGTLRVSGLVAGTGAVTVASGGTLSGPITSGASGSMAGATTIQSGGTVAGFNGATLNLTSGLTLANGSSSAFNLSGTPNGIGDPSAAMVVTSGGAGRSLTIGSISGEVHTINLSGIASATPGSASYDLISYAGAPLISSGPSSGSTLAFTNAPGSLVLGTLPFGPFAYQLVNNPGVGPNGGGQIDLAVTTYPMTWTGAQGSSWDTTGQSQNFAALAPTPFAAAYVDSATVSFGDTNILAGNSPLGQQFPTVQSGGVRPASITFTNTGFANGGADYTFTNAINPGTGVTDTVGIAGSTGLTLNGNGSGLGGQVILNGANSFTGPVQVNAGDLSLGVAAALGSSSGVTVASGAELDLNSSATATFGSAVNGSGGIPLTLAGTGLTSSPSGALNNVSGINTYAGPITLAGSATIASTSASNGDSLTLSGAIDTTAGGFALTFTGSDNTTVTGAITGAGSVSYNGGGSAILTLSGTNKYSGGTTINSGLLTATKPGALGSGQVTLSGGNLKFGGTTATIAPDNALAVTANATIDVTGPTSVTVGTLQVGAVTLAVTGGGAGAGTNYSLTTGAVTLTGNAEFDISNNSIGTGAGSLRLGAIGDGGNHYGVTINNNGLASPGTVVLLNGGSYSGPTNVNVGTLQVNGTVTGAGAVTIANSAVLSGPVTAGGSGSLAGTVTLANGGTIAANNGATFSLAGGLTLSSGSNSSFNLTGSPNGTANPAAALIATSGGAGPRSLVTGAASGDTSVVNLTGTMFAQPGTWTYDLISYTGTPLSASPASGTSLTFANGTAMTLGSVPTGPYSNVQLVNNPGGSGGQIDLQLTAYPITWSGGSNGNAWDTTTFNWAFAPPSGTSSTNYVEGAYVTFADNSLFGSPVANTNGVATVSVQPSGVNPGAIAVTNTGPGAGGVDYVFTGGRIGGAATVLTKTGAGTLTINNSNTYGGGTLINAGTVVAGQPTALGTGPVTLSGGILRLGTNISGFGGTSANNSGTGTWTVNSSGISSNPINNDVLTLTDNTANVQRSAFYNIAAPAVSSSSGFSAQFIYTAGGSKAADGAVFTLQNSPNGASAIGATGTSVGSSLGYGGGAGVAIAPSVAFEMNIFSSNTVGVTWKSNGATGGYTALSSAVNLASGDPIRVQLNYNQANTTLTAILTDTTTNAVATFSSSALDVASILGQGTAYVGFSGASGGSTATQTISGFTYATTGASANDVTISPSMTSTIDIAASTLSPGYTLGNLTVGGGGAATLNVTATAAAPNLSYGLTFGSATLNSNANLNVANNGAGAGALRVLGPVSDGGAGKSLTLSGPGVVNLAGNGSYSGGTTVSAGTLAIGLSNNPAGSGTITLAGGNLQLYGQTSGTPVAGLTTAFYNGAASLSTSSPTNDPHFATLSALQSFVGSNTPAAVSVSTAGGMTTLNWPNSAGGALFAPQGFTSTSNIEAVIAGTLQIAQNGIYTFQTGSDDGSMLYIDGSPAAQVSNNGNHGFTTVTGSAIPLTAGVHSIVIGYFNGSDGAQLLVNYKGPDTGNVFTAIPDTALMTSSSAAFPSATQTYTNNISVTSNATINVTGSLAATVGNLSLAGSTLSVTSSDLSTGPYSLSVGSLNVTGATGVNVAASSSSGAGTLRVTAPPTFAAGSSLNIGTGRVQFNVNTTGATVGTGATATVASGATLELAGSASALASLSGKVNIVNNSSSAGIVVSGVAQVVGNIDGTGTTQVNGGSDLTANHIIQTALVIGGTASSTGLVTIDASDANGNPLAATAASLSGTLPLAGTIPSDGPFTAGTSGGSNLASSDNNGSTGAVPVGSDSSSAASTGGNGAVPEPASVLLALVALAMAGVPLAKARRRGGNKAR